MIDLDRIADALIQLNNASPRLPRKDEIVDVLKVATTVPVAPDGDVLKVATTVPVPPDGPNVIVGGAALGASIVVVQDSRIATNGWHIGIKNGYQPTAEEVTIAILDFLKAALVAKKATPAPPGAVIRLPFGRVIVHTAAVHGVRYPQGHSRSPPTQPTSGAYARNRPQISGPMDRITLLVAPR